MKRNLAFGFIGIFIGILLFNAIASDFGAKKNVAFSPTSPYWVKVSKIFSDFSAAATTNTLTIYTVPGNQMVMNVIMRHTTAFSGGAVSALTGSVGITGQAQMYVPNSTMFSAPSATTFYTLSTPIVSVPFNTTSSTNVTATLNSTSANLSALTAGGVDYYILLSQLP